MPQTAEEIKQKIGKLVFYYEDSEMDQDVCRELANKIEDLLQAHTTQRLSELEEHLEEIIEYRENPTGGALRHNHSPVSQARTLAYKEILQLIDEINS